MKRYNVVTCANCGTEYNPLNRPVCPAVDCEEETPVLAPPEDTLLKRGKKSTKKATKAVAPVEESSSSEE